MARRHTRALAVSQRHPRTLALVVAVTILLAVAGAVTTRGGEGPGVPTQERSSRQDAAAGEGNAQDVARLTSLGDGLTPLLQQEWGCSQQLPGDLEQVASSVLSSYRSGAPCVLAGEGYLDLMGSVWACVIRGDGWSEVCVVSEEEGGRQCQVNVLRIDADEVERLLTEEDDG